MKRKDHQLVQRVLDGDVSREEFDAFQDRLRKEPKLEAHYREYALLHHSLSEEHGDGPYVGECAAEPSGRGLRVVFPVLALVLAMLGALIWIGPRFEGGDADGVALVSFSPDAVWEMRGASGRAGDAAWVDRGCVLDLKAGRAEVVWESAGTAILEAPAEVVFVSHDALRLTNGSGCFRPGGDGVTVTGGQLKAVSRSGEFGLRVTRGGADELRAEVGGLEVVARSGGRKRKVAEGQALRAVAGGGMEEVTTGEIEFARDLGSFRTVFQEPFVKDDWRLAFGTARIAAGKVDGGNFEAFCALPGLVPDEGDRVLLATLELGDSSEGEFHTDGWAGLSFYREGEELLFFGDAFGRSDGWALDVKHEVPMIHPDPPTGALRKMTLRYEPASGRVSLHAGGVPLGSPVCRGEVPAGTRFDEIRVAASAGAAVAVKALHIRAGGG